MIKDGNAIGQAKITNYFDPVTFSDVIDNRKAIRENLNEICGNDRDGSVKPILLKLFENAQKNNEKQSTKGNRHDQTIKKFASSLFCLIGKSSYEMLQANLGSALPSISTLQRNISNTKKIKEGEFRFDELIDHLKNWNAPLGVHIHLDDTRILKRVEYDPATGRFVGFCLPIKDGFPVVDAFLSYKHLSKLKKFTSLQLLLRMHTVLLQSLSALLLHLSCYFCLGLIRSTHTLK